jgi:transposase
MMQFETTIHAQTPRIACPKHGIRSLQVPWAGAHTRFTLLFESFAITVLQSAASTSAAQRILKISWDQVNHIKDRAVTRGLARRESEDVMHVGVDEKNFRKGHNYVSLATDLDAGRVLDVVEGRKKEDAILLLNKAIPEEKRAMVQAGAMDMWDGFMGAWTTVFGTDIPIVHDKFHVAKYLSEAVDTVRKGEHKTLLREGSSLLVKTKFLWLKNTESWSADEKKQWGMLMQEQLKVGRAWTLKELFNDFWHYSYTGSAQKFFNKWYFRATHSRLQPIIAVAKMLKRHITGLLAYSKHNITNAVTEGLNSKIQSVKANARGFRNFANYRTAILFHCGKLNMMP